VRKTGPVVVEKGVSFGVVGGAQNFLLMGNFWVLAADGQLHTTKGRPVRLRQEKMRKSFAS